VAPSLQPTNGDATIIVAAKDRAQELLIRTAV
jgi:hypothetical protein